MTNESKGLAVITGASTGIGAVYADRLARRGYDLLLVARDQSRMTALADRLRAETGRKIDIRSVDLTDPEKLAALAARIEGESRLALLVNNAGMSIKDSLLTGDPSEPARLIALNITAPTVLAGAAGRNLVKAGKGGIINLSSVLALAPEMFEGAYSASKAYILNLSIALARDLSEAGVRVQAVLPGATRTEIWERSGKDVNAFPPEWVMEPGDLVDAALAGFDAGEVVTIPPLADEGLWKTAQEARLALGPNLSRREVAARYRKAA
ncbi:3-oxoacyl-[acyl-carrier-protein] reductase FabG [Hartmannibacter diazotrophicus]|uniref:3-oxoacyl-[acyl-carrier-protein] reductase FabG n=1 Tax=Hartmannibacter diazotrophicus TaxID=1482074 RepID=A0A2C9D507_9HYPH|nr:SDR family oxidoreductase [Hartmannibacter diazotrophicus]SON55394.1 3-oxoacyl-[acyl-carrier-protein] reductase FabG [Hartmannibacter diazotrophicus]